MAKSLYIIDGHAQIYRAFYAPFRDLTSPSGEPTRATFVFCQMLFNLLKNRRPDYLAMAMDVSDETVFRKAIDANYKAHRDPAPEALHVQADRIASIVEMLGIPLLRVAGFEADDLMATIVSRLDGTDVNVYLVSRDKDLEQLLGPRVRLFDPFKDEIIDAEKLQATKGYTPAQAVEVQTLAGDATDNVPGVPGVGPKTAAKLISTYDTVESVIAHADKLTPKLAEQIRAFATQAPITRQLVTLRRDVPFSFELEQSRVDRIDPAVLRPVFEELGFTRLREALDAFASFGTTQSAQPQRIFESATDRGAYMLVHTPEQLEVLARSLAEHREFAFDTETTSLHPVSADLVGLSFAFEEGRAYYVPVRAAVGDCLPLPMVVERLKPALENEAVRKIGHNIKFDALALRSCGIVVAGIDFDTMIASFLLDPAGRSHSLDGLALSMLGHRMIPITDLIGKGRGQITLDQVDVRQVCEYAAEDADFTWRIYRRLRNDMNGSHVEELFTQTEMPLVDVLIDMEHRGIALDTELLASLSQSLAKRMEELRELVMHHAGRPFNVDSTRQLAEILYDEQHLPVLKKTKTARSTDAETLALLAERTNHSIPKLVLEYRELAKLKGTYVDTLPTDVCPRTGRVHATFHQIGAITGRLSSSDPNLQNIPIRTELGKQIRKAFIAGSPDELLLTADYSQIELRILAHLSKDKTLVEAFHAGKDIHKVVAAQVNNVPLDEVTPSQRSAAKAVNFGIVYGQSAFGLARSLGISNTEAKDFIDAYFRRYPGIKRFMGQCIEDARGKGYAQTLLGRRRPLPELRSRNRQQVSQGERLAINTVVQGTAADLIKRAMVDVHRRSRKEQAGTHMLIQVHDELVFEVARNRVEEEAARIRRDMAGAIELDVPLVVETAWGPTWADGKS